MEDRDSVRGNLLGVGGDAKDEGSGGALQGGAAEEHGAREAGVRRAGHGFHAQARFQRGDLDCGVCVSRRCRFRSAPAEMKAVGGPSTPLYTVLRPHLETLAPPSPLSCLASQEQERHQLQQLRPSVRTHRLTTKIDSNPNIKTSNRAITPVGSGGDPHVGVDGILLGV